MALNPYGNLGPSPATVRRIDALRRRGGGVTTQALPAGPRRPAAPAYDPIQAQLDAYLKPRLAAIDYERQKAAEMASRRVRDLTGFTQALMQTLGQIPGAIRTPFEAGAGSMGALGTGYGGVLNADSAARAAGANATLDSIGAPEGQQVQGGDAGGALAGIAGWLPQMMLQGQGDALAGAAQQLPATAGWGAQLQLRSMMNDAAQQDADFNQQISDVYGELPGMKAKLVSDQQKFDYQRLKDERDWYLKQAALARAMGDTKRSNQYLKLAQDREHRQAMASQGLDVNGNPRPGYTRDASGAIVKIPTKGSSKDPSVIQAKSRKAREDEFRKARLDAVDEARKLIAPATALRPEQRPSWQVAYSKLFNRYKDLLRFGTKGGQKKLRARIDQLITEALIQNGWEKPKSKKPNGTEVGNT